MLLDAKGQNEYLELLDSGDYQIAYTARTADVNDATEFLSDFEATGGNNYTNWENETYQDLMKQAHNALDPDERKAILIEAEEMLMDEMVILPVFFDTNTYAYKNDVHDIEVDALGNIHFKWSYVTEKDKNSDD